MKDTECCSMTGEVLQAHSEYNPVGDILSPVETLKTGQQGSCPSS